MGKKKKKTTLVIDDINFRKPICPSGFDFKDKKKYNRKQKFKRVYRPSFLF